ncbi:MAG: GNAT family N-acetyltransferase [Treponema sp.]|jgi:predicted N-acetyltransferase YhbS|nr:GNAT family N-acetyltransferase [Treponema sp.]
MRVEYSRADINDYEEVIDAANYVFSHDHRPTDFPALLPKLYKREYFMDAAHYLCREDGKIKAAVGAYPLEMKLCGTSLRGRGIGMVFVHPYSRSKGYMRELMNRALEDMRKDGMVFSCLDGRRQRYEYFGFSPAGTVFSFECNSFNTHHTLGKNFVPSLTPRRLCPKDSSLIEEIRFMHEAKPEKGAGFVRRTDRFFDVLVSWENSVYAVLEGEKFSGYLIYNEKENLISEVNLKDSGRMAETIDLCLKSCPPGKAVKVISHPHETEKLKALSRFAESVSMERAYSFNIFNYRSFLDAFVKLQCSLRLVEDGAFVFEIENGERLCVRVSGGKAAVHEASPSETAGFKFGTLAATEFFFSPVTPYTSSLIAGNSFLRSLLPLPLFFESADGV